MYSDEITHQSMINTERMELIHALSFDNTENAPLGRFLIRPLQEADLSMVKDSMKAPTYEFIVRSIETGFLYGYVLDINLIGNGPVYHLVGQQAFLDEVWTTMNLLCEEHHVAMVDLTIAGTNLLGHDSRINGFEYQDNQEEIINHPFPFFAIEGGLTRSCLVAVVHGLGHVYYPQALPKDQQTPVDELDD